MKLLQLHATCVESFMDNAKDTFGAVLLIGILYMFSNSNIKLGIFIPG